MEDTVSTENGDGMETATCILCGSKEQDTLLCGPDRLLIRPGSYCLRQCRHCGLIFQHPPHRTDGDTSAYPDSYQPYQVAIEEEPSRWRRWDRRYGLWKRRHLISSYVTHPGTLLDYGCATGVFLDYMGRHRWKTFGVEPNCYAAGYARNRFHLKIFSSPVSAQDFFARDSLDVVTLWDVLEHVSDPLTLLRNLSLWLKPDGYLILTLPDPDSWERRWFGRYWVGWDLPRHLHLFPRSTLRLLLTRCGFRIDEMTHFTGRYHTFLMSLTWLLQDKWPHARSRKILLAILRSWPLRLAGLGLFKLSDRFCPGTSLTVIARKRYD